MYACNVKGRDLTFGVSGKLLDRVLIMYDRQTGSEWSHLTGLCLAGKLKGTQLEASPRYEMTSLGQWVLGHPATRVLKPVHPMAVYRQQKQKWAGYFSGQRSGKVLGLFVGLKARHYAFSDLEKHSIVNDSFAGKSLLAVFEKESDTAEVFLRTAQGKTLTFAAAGTGEDGRMGMKDDQTGSLWDALSGEAISGPLKGTHLERQPSTHSFAYGWDAYFPESEKWTPP